MGRPEARLLSGPGFTTRLRNIGKRKLWGEFACLQEPSLCRVGCCLGRPEARLLRRPGFTTWLRNSGKPKLWNDLTCREEPSQRRVC